MDLPKGQRLLSAALVIIGGALLVGSTCVSLLGTQNSVSNSIVPRREDGPEARPQSHVHSRQAVQDQRVEMRVRSIETRDVGAAALSRPAPVVSVSLGRLGPCVGPAYGSPNIKPSRHNERPKADKHIRRNVEAATSDPEAVSYVAPSIPHKKKATTLPTARSCRAIDALAIPVASITDGGVEGMDTLVKFGQANRVLPTCDISRLRSWGGFSLASDCTAGPGTHFGRGSISSFTSYDMEKKWQARLKGKMIARIAWAPGLRKCGSTPLANYFQHTVGWHGTMDKHARLADDPLKHPDKWTDEQIANKFFQFTVVRDPLSHFLAGAHQLSVFHRLGWLGLTNKEWGIDFWNRTCMNTTWGKVEPCAPPYANPVEQLEVILDDIERVGFFDEHIFPMTYPIALSRGLINPANFYIFDMSNITVLENAINVVVFNESEAGSRFKTGTHLNIRGEKGIFGNQVMPWAIRSRDLLELSEHDCKARRVVQRFCALYAEDYACLPYTLPRVCQASA